MMDTAVEGLSPYEYESGLERTAKERALINDRFDGEYSLNGGMTPVEIELLTQEVVNNTSQASINDWMLYLFSVAKTAISRSRVSKTLTSFMWSLEDLSQEAILECRLLFLEFPTGEELPASLIEYKVKRAMSRVASAAVNKERRSMGLIGRIVDDGGKDE